MNSRTHTTTVALLLAAAVAGLSCTQNAAPTTAHNPPAESAFAPHNAAVRTSAHAGAAVANRTSSTPAPAPQPTIPAGARYTIACTTFTGPNHATDAQAARQQLLSTGLRDWHILQGDQQTTLYYGYYRSISDDDPRDAKERQRAHNDLKAVANLTEPRSGEKYFKNCFLIALEEANPSAPPDWDLHRAPGYWSLQIAAFRDHPRRKEFAVETVRDLRNQGHNAFYYHGPTMSSVCLGAFPREAVNIQKREYQAKSPNDVVVVMPESIPVPDRQIVTPQGENVDIVKPKVEVRDPALARLMNDFPHHSDNQVIGRRVMSQGVWKDVYQPTFLVVIPGQDAVASDRAPGQTSTTVDPFQALQRRGTAPQGGQLKSIE